MIFLIVVWGNLLEMLVLTVKMSIISSMKMKIIPNLCNFLPLLLIEMMYFCKGKFRTIIFWILVNLLPRKKMSLTSKKYKKYLKFLLINKIINLMLNLKNSSRKIQNFYFTWASNVLVFNVSVESVNVKLLKM